MRKKSHVREKNLTGNVTNTPERFVSQFFLTREKNLTGKATNTPEIFISQFFLTREKTSHVREKNLMGKATHTLEICICWAIVYISAMENWAAADVLVSDKRRGK